MAKITHVREIVLDTETTGINPEEGHRVISLGCVELIDKTHIANKQHWFFNPERDIPEESFKIHRISGEFLADKPKFGEVVDDILNFLARSPLVIHNSTFDMKFLNSEMAKCGKPPLTNQVVDTLVMARQLFVNEKNSLDALGERFAIFKATQRDTHDALLDAEILCEVYQKLVAQSMPQKPNAPTAKMVDKRKEQHKEQIVYPPTETELLAHQKIMAKIATKQ